MSAIFRQIFIFHEMIALQKLWKMFLFYLKSSFRSQNIQISVFLSSLLFLSISHCFIGCSRINLQVYHVINCLSKDLITHFVWYLEKEKWYGIETLTIDRKLNKEHLLWKNHIENVHQRLVSDLFLILGNKPKQQLDARNYFKNKIFWKRVIKKP